MTLRLAVLGDSIAFGVGAARPQDTLAARLTADLTAHGHPSEGRAFAVPGARSTDLPPQVARALGWRPEIAVVVIGANDLTRLVPVRHAAAALGAAVQGLRAGGVAVVVAPAPDLSVVPHVPAALRGLVQAGSGQLRRAQAAAAIAAGARVATSDVSAEFARNSALFSRDRFHPSSAGYALIAASLTPAVRAAAEEIDGLRRSRTS